MQQCQLLMNVPHHPHQRQDQDLSVQSALTDTFWTSVNRALSFQERLAFVQQKQLCLNCFIKGHRSTVCTRSWVCKVHGCWEKHNSWMHSTIVASNNDDKSQSTNLATGGEPAANPPQAIQAHATRKCFEASRKKIALPILPVVVSDRHNRFSMNVFALLDSGSNGTFAL